MKNIRFKIIKDHPTVSGMLYKDEIVMVDIKDDIVLLDKRYESYANSSQKIKVKDLMGRLYIIEGIYLKRI